MCKCVVKAITLLAAAIPLAAQGGSAQPAGLALGWSRKPLEDNVEVIKTVANSAGVWAAGNVSKISMPGVTYNPAKDAFVSRMSPATGETLWTVRLSGSNADVAMTLEADSAGNSYVAGATMSTDFPLRNAYQSVFPPPEPNPPGPMPTSYAIGFLTKLDPDGNIVFSTLLGGGSYTEVLALAVDSSGSVVATGDTTASNFPTTDGAPIRTFSKLPFGSPAFAFVTKFSPSGQSLMYSTLLGAPSRYCKGAANCLGAVANTTGTALAIDSAGNTWVTGRTTAENFPVSPDAFQKSVKWDIPPGWKVFLTKVNTLGTAFVYSTYLGGSFPGSDYPAGLALAPDGKIILAGSTSSTDFPVTDGSQNTSGSEIGFVSLFSAEAPALVFSSYTDDVSALALDGNRLWLAGEAGPDYIAAFDLTARKTTFRRTLPPGISNAYFSGTGLTLYFAGASSGWVSRVDTAADGPPALVGVTSAAGGDYRDTVSPGELVTLFGFNLGPAQPAYATVEGNRVTSAIGGVKVYFAGMESPLLYAGARQINAVVPFGIPKTGFSVQLVRDERLVATAPLRSVNVQPEIFQPVVNQDYSINSPDNPAHTDGILIFWATGGGDLSPRPADGAVTGANMPSQTETFSVEFDGQPLQILYAGPAPGMVSGVMQFNVRLPSEFSYQNELILKSGSYASAPRNIAFDRSIP